MKHYLHPALAGTSGHAVTVDVIGAGGTGSALLTHLARLHLSLLARNHLGLRVRVFDPDNVEQPNLVRQHFTEYDLGRNKATVAVERLNAFYGLDWQAVPQAWDAHWMKRPIGFFACANITVTCVDTVASRRTLYNQVRRKYPNYGVFFEKDGTLNATAMRNPAGIPLYWLDIGNGRDMGQVLLSTFGWVPQPDVPLRTAKGGKRNSPQPKRLVRVHPSDNFFELQEHEWNGQLPTIFDLYKDLEQFEDVEQGPSCSLLQALEKQSIMVNPMMATAAANLLAQMFEQTSLSHVGCYVNLKTLTMAPISVPAVKQHKLERV